MLRRKQKRNKLAYNYKQVNDAAQLWVVDMGIIFCCKKWIKVNKA